ncbi:MAG: GIY-YIG nuclease family protein [Deltaproteobacteria bacterium]|nr:GIY-YIG nuclease family protein [Deltaproteobacteria bacterium]
MTISVTLDWQRVISPSEFDQGANRDFLMSNGGTYIWIFKGTPYRVTYVGETKVFANRFVDHFSSILTGRWNTYDMDEGDDFVKFLYEHYHDKTLDEIRAKNKCFIPNQPHKPSFSFRKTFFEDTCLITHRRYLKNLAFAFAACDTLEDSNIRKQVEGILIVGLRRLYAEYVEDKKIKSLRSKESRSYDIPIGNVSRKPTDSFTISHVGDAVNDIPEDVVKIIGFDFKRRQPVFAH